MCLIHKTSINLKQDEKLKANLNEGITTTPVLSTLVPGVDIGQLCNFTHVIGTVNIPNTSGGLVLSNQVDMTSVVDTWKESNSYNVSVVNDCNQYK